MNSGFSTENMNEMLDFLYDGKDKRITAIKNLKCVICDNLVFIFKDQLSRQIFLETGMCQHCQNESIFKYK